MDKPQRGQEVRLAIDTLAFGGRGLGRLGDFVVFVDGALPGDTVLAEVTRTKRRYAEARLLEITTPSPARRDARCRHAGSCGGCRWQSLDYAVQLRYKTQQVVDSLERLGGLSGFDVAPAHGMDDPWRYRNKVEFSIGDSAGGLVVGFHPPGRWDQVMPLDECLLMPHATETVRTVVEEWLRRRRLEPWDARARRGYARHLTVREAHHTGEVLVDLVTAPGGLPGADDLVARLRERTPGIVGVLHSENAGLAEVAGGLPHQVLFGRPYLLERLGDLELKISIDAFFQTNTRMAEVLYGTVAAEAALTGTDVVWDLYAGIGSIGLYLAPRAGAVLGIETVAAAVADARENAAKNGIENATFLEGDTRPLLKEVLLGRLALPPGVERPDVVVIDPPRGGLAHKVIARVAAAAPSRIVYVSCNPGTMAPNLALFAEAGYRLRRVTPVDMFPHTPHIEAVGLLEPAPTGA